MPFMRYCGKIKTAKQATGDSVIRPMRFACWVATATDTLRMCDITAFSRQN